MSTWKAVERSIAALLGGERVPVTGRSRGSAPDIAHDTYSIEVKHRKTLPAWILDAFNQADASNTGGQIPLVILHQSGMRYGDSIACVRLSDLIELAEGKKSD